ncbi:MAG: HAD family hydrolase [Clostridia bacterium]|nr:HAD family hydrolase [Clostridia bacterium]
MNKLRWIFFDIGSTLVDESAVYENRISQITHNGNIDKNEFTERIKQLAQTEPKPIVAAAAEYGAAVPAWRHDLERLYPESKKVLQTLGKNYKIGIIANQEFGTEKRLTNFGIRQYIDIIISSAEEGTEKPDLKIFQTALERADCIPEEAVMVGDRLDNDISPANRLGMKTVWIKQGFSRYAEPKKSEEQPDCTIGNLSELLNIF